ncbi:MAG: hypothetical protein IPP82_10540 [Xanthomonadales bacterium]|nr:hypothetical protein [Xanthomonadales bacterium]
MQRLILTALLTLLSLPAVAATYKVTNTGDNGEGTLRDAMEAANDHTGADTIVFDIPGNGVHTIAPTSFLPQITDALIIDGYTQPGAQPNTNLSMQGGLNGTLLIELSGANLNYNSRGLYLRNGDTTIRGLVMNGFYWAISVGDWVGAPGAFNTTIEGCYLGTDPTGTTAVGSNQYRGIDDGVQVQKYLVVGGATAAARNLISGFSGSYGILANTEMGGPVIRGNLIGTNASGTAAIPNFHGIGINQVVLDSVPPSGLIQDNLISGNSFGGLQITCLTPCIKGLVISGNVIGARYDRNSPLPNQGYGIRFSNNNASETSILIGGETEDSQNFIAWNSTYGVTISNTSNGTFEIARNLIFNNTAMDIDLPNPEHGRNYNDSDDFDEFANRMQNFPVIVSAARSGDQLTVRYKVPTATSHATYPLTIRFYRGATSGGDRWLANDSYDAVDAQMEKQTVLTIPSGIALPALIATAADAVGNTSEFSDRYVMPVTDLIFANGFEQP